MEQIYYEDNPALAVSKCAACLKSGGTAVAPAGTVYGLVAQSDSAEAYAQIFRIKRRAISKPIALLVSENSKVYQSLLAVIEGQSDLLAGFLAGQITVVVDAIGLDGLPGHIQQIQPGAVGIRYPANSPLCAILQEAGGLVWGTSANFSEHHPCSTAGEVKTWIQATQPPPDLIVLSHHPQQGKPSQVVMLQG